MKKGAIVEEPFGPDEDDDEILDVEVVEDTATAVVEQLPKPTEFQTALPGRKLTSFTDIYDSKEIMKFIIPGVLPESGLVFLGGLSATGKTILAIQLVI